MYPGAVEESPLGASGLDYLKFVSVTCNEESEHTLSPKVSGRHNCLRRASNLNEQQLLHL